MKRNTGAAALSIFAVAIMAMMCVMPMIGDNGNDTYAYVRMGEISEDSIPVSDADDLERVGTGAEYPTSSGVIWSLGAEYHLINDIILSGTNNHAPIGGNSSATAFSGTFDGNGYKIIGLDIDTETGNAALFNTTYYAVIINIEVENANLAGYNAGGIVCNATNTQIYNCSFSGTITAVSSAGGIAAIGSNSEITNCRNNGTIHVTNELIVDAFLQSYNQASAAGIIAPMFQNSISNCYNTGDINIYVSLSGQEDYITVDVVIAAFGIGLGTISNCYNTGDISINYSNTSSGIFSQIYTTVDAAGIGSGTISNCYNTGDIYIDGLTGERVGGITATMNGYIVNCYNAGEIYASASSYIGGIAGIGSNTRHIVNCYFLSGTIYKGGSQVPDALYGYTAPIVDGTSDPVRLPAQESGAKTSSEMRPDINAARSNNSIYFSGTTEVGSTIYEGWDFESIWTIDSLTNEGYPVLVRDSDIDTGNGSSDMTMIYFILIAIGIIALLVFLKFVVRLF